VRKEAALPNENVRQDWVGYPKAQRFSGLSQRTLRKLIGNGELCATKIGRATKIDKRSLEAFMENHPAQPRLPGFEEVDV
jgi:excisionase family DNA binding protein